MAEPVSDFPDVLLDTMKRLKLNRREMADYFGVPLSTFNKWLGGQRTAPSVAIRLLEVMRMIESLAPMIHDSIVNQCVKRG